MQQPDALPQVEIDLDIQLKDDHVGLLKMDLLQQLEGHQKKIRSVLDKGCSPSDYAIYQELLVAINSAKEVIQVVWARLH